MNVQDAVNILIADGHLLVKPDGTIWRITARSRGATKPITPKRAETLKPNGYLGVRVDLAGKQYMAYAHRMVWETLIGPIPEGMDINHLDGNKTNNAPANLELATRSENHLHAYRTGLRKPAAIPKLAAAMPEAKRLRAQGLSYEKIGKALGIAAMTAYRAING